MIFGSLFNDVANFIRDKWVPVITCKARPHVADGETASHTDGSCDYIE